MKALPWVLGVLLIAACVVVWFLPRKPQVQVRTETRIKTVVQVETLLVSAPIALFFRLTGDTVRIKDTIVLREQVYYADSLYQVWVSGYQPRLDSMKLFPRTVYRTVTNDVFHMVVPKRKRWGAGLQVGYGYPGGWYVGAGVSYDLWQW